MPGPRKLRVPEAYDCLVTGTYASGDVGILLSKFVCADRSGEHKVNIEKTMIFEQKRLTT